MNVHATYLNGGTPAHRDPALSIHVLPGGITLLFGLAGAVELTPRAGAPGRRTYDIFLDCYQRGVLVRPSGESLVLAPPFIVEPAHIDQMVGTLAESIRRHA